MKNIVCFVQQIERISKLDRFFEMRKEADNIFDTLFDQPSDSVEELLSLKERIKKLDINHTKEAKTRSRKVLAKIDDKLDKINFKYWQDDWGEEKEKWPVSDFAQKVYKYINNKNYHTLLDLGCGNGRDAIFFYERGLTVTAVDISESGIESLRKKNNQIAAILGNIKNISFPKESFDIVYAHLSLQYFDLDESEIIFDKLHRILTPGGMIFVRCKSTDDPKYGEGTNLSGNIYFKSHLRHFFTEDLMKKLLTKYKDVEINKTSHIRDDRVSRFIEGVGRKR